MMIPCQKRSQEFYRKKHICEPTSELFLPLSQSRVSSRPDELVVDDDVFALPRGLSPFKRSLCAPLELLVFFVDDEDVSVPAWCEPVRVSEGL